MKWPGTAAVMVSVIHFTRAAPKERTLDGNPVDYISAFLAPTTSNDDPETLVANVQLAFQGSNLDGTGFVFSDSDDKAHPLSEMHRVSAANPRCSEVIWPLLGGEELNTAPTLTPSRFVIRFGGRELAECEQAWPELVELVRASVLPFRERRPDNPQSRRLKKLWWRWHTERPTLYSAMAGRARVLVNSQVSSRMAFAFQPTDIEPERICLVQLCRALLSAVADP
jgi:hypothetical protein